MPSFPKIRVELLFKIPSFVFSVAFVIWWWDNPSSFWRRLRVSREKANCSGHLDRWHFGVLIWPFHQPSNNSREHNWMWCGRCSSPAMSKSVNRQRGKRGWRLKGQRRHRLLLNPGQWDSSCVPLPWMLSPWPLFSGLGPASSASSSGPSLLRALFSVFLSVLRQDMGAEMACAGRLSFLVIHARPPSQAALLLGRQDLSGASQEKGVSLQGFLNCHSLSSALCQEKAKPLSFSPSHPCC